MTLAVLLYLAAWIWCALLAVRWRLGRDLLEHVALGAAGALTVVCWIPFLCALVVGIRVGTFAGLVVIVSLAGWEIFRQRVTLRFPPGLFSKERLALAAALLVGALLFARLQWTHGLQPKDGGIFAGGPAWEDQPGHTAIALSFAYGENLARFDYPWFSGWPLGYPFLSDYLTGALQMFGAGLPGAVWLGMAFSSVAFLLAGYALARDWLGHRGQAALAVGLALGAGSLGWWALFTDFPEGKTLVEALRERDYANSFDHQLHLQNLTTAVLLIMRTSTFGMPVALAALLLLGRAAEARSPRHAAAAGALTALLPLLHTHSFLVVGVVAACWLILWRVWSRAVAVAWLTPLLFAVPQVLWTRQQIAHSAQSFIRFVPGWMCPERTLAANAHYWWMNAGLLLPLALLAWGLADARRRKLSAPFFVLFLLAALVVFQPNDFDNIKLFAFATCALSILVAGLIGQMWRAHFALRGVAVLAALAIVAGGVCSLVNAWFSSWQIADREGIAFAEKVRAATPPDAVLLTGQRATHPAFFLSGRRVFLGFHNWIGQHGMTLEPRRSDVIEIYSGGPRAVELLTQHDLRWVVIGPPEREEFPRLDEDFFRQRASVVATEGEYSLYQLRFRLRVLK